MSLRLRLGLWYGALTGVVVLVVSILTYAAHTRGHYDDLDFTLRATAEHMAQEYEAGAPLPAQAGGPVQSIPQSIAVLVCDRAGGIVAESPGAAQAPRIDPLGTLAHPSGPPFDPLAALSPPMDGDAPSGGAFGMSPGPDGSRWRYYVMPFHGGTHFLVAADSLARLDASIAQFRWLMVGLTLSAALIALVAGWLLAARALRPVSVMTGTAGEIERSRSFERRVPVTADRDELGRLAATFNDMLASLERAYQAQQRFVSDASHELRAPLTAIQGNLDLLERIPDMPPDERQEAVREANREAARLSRLVADLLALARADAGVSTRREPVELDRVLLQAFADARHLARGQQLEVDELEPALVRGDADRLKQLFVILLDNALKYTPPDGKVAVCLRTREGQVEVSVQDNGIGIAPGDLPHVFDRFYRADPARSRDPGGTGLGLSIARWIVQQHGGEIALQSEPRRGTAVTVRLPLATTPVRSQASAPA